MRASQTHLLGLINEVLNYAKIESGAVRYEINDVAIDAVVDSIDPLIRPLFDARRVRFTIGEIPATLAARADDEKLRQVLINLLSNASKFTHAGGEVRVEHEIGRGARAGSVALHVIDSGEGIPADRLASIFEPFVQVESGLTRTRQGAGLGLAIARDLARGMGGDLTVASEYGVGSTFSVWLPSAAPSR